MRMSWYFVSMGYSLIQTVGLFDNNSVSPITLLCYNMKLLLPYLTKEIKHKEPMKKYYSKSDTV